MAMQQDKTNLTRDDADNMNDSNHNDHNAVIDSCRAAYIRQFSSSPAYIALAPGRVNLIGEHIDHQGYPVLPIAITQSVRVAIGQLPNKHSHQSSLSASAALQIHHVNPTLFPPVILPTIQSIQPVVPHMWANYVISSVLGLREFLSTVKSDGVVPVLLTETLPTINNTSQFGFIDENEGLILLVDGNVPLAAGVSSSSALVVATMLALVRYFNIPMSRLMLASVCANAERHVGTAGGGMDQAAICLSRQGTAQLIRFVPLSAESVPLPSSAAMIVSNSGSLAPKAVNAATCYNKRVFELAIAGFMMLKATIYPHDDPLISEELFPTLTLRKVQERLNVTFQEALNLAKKHISDTPYSRKEIENIVGIPRLSRLLNQRVGSSVWDQNTTFDPLRRAIHVYSEAERVAEFVTLCRNSSVSERDKLKGLGTILNESDASLTTLFECGTPELTTLTVTAGKLGAYGARLVGAGWGGCTLSLVGREDVPEFIREMRKVVAAVVTDSQETVNAISNSSINTNSVVVTLESPRWPPIMQDKKSSMQVFSVIPEGGAAVYDGRQQNGSELPWE